MAAPVKRVRNLEEDLVMCERWDFGNPYNSDLFIREALEGWPYAIRRALEAETEIDRLWNELNILQEQLEQRGCCT